MDISNAISLQIMMFIIMALGFWCTKAGILNATTKKAFIDLIITIVLPCNIINAFQIDADPSLLIALGKVVIIALIVQIFCLILSHILYRKTDHRQRMVLRYATICSNAGFLGNPVAEGIYGSIGLLYASIYLIPQRIFMWSAGLSCFTPAKGKEVVKELLTHPCIIATVIGFVLMLAPVNLPDFALKTLSSVGGCTTALSMLVIGCMMSEVNFKTVISRQTLYYCFIRLVFIPAVILAAGALAKVDPLILGVSVVLAGMPAGSTTAILASKYSGDEVYATKCVFLSTFLSMITIPLLCIALQKLYV